MRFRFQGPVRGIYASLVVKLIYSVEFEKDKLHRNAALLKASHDHGRTCGLAFDYPDPEDDSLGRMTVFFDDGARGPSKTLFVQYIRSQLEAMAFPDSVIAERIYHCGYCNLTIESKAVEIARSRGRDAVSCSVCEMRFPLDDLVAESQPSKESSATIDGMNRQAEVGQRLASLKTTIDRRQDDGRFDLFLCHNSQDKPSVREFATDLRDLGLLGWIDEEQLLPGDVVQEKLERAIETAGAIAVCIGPAGLGRWQTVEYHTVYERFISESEPDDVGGRFRSDRGLRVIPVLLPGAQPRQIPAFLKRHLYVDLRPSAKKQRPAELRKLAAAVLTDRRR